MAKRVKVVPNDMLAEASANEIAQVPEEVDSAGQSVDMEEEDEGDEIDEPFKPDDVRFQQRPLNVRQVIDNIEHKEINLNPDFQRKKVWNVVKQSRLIESLMLRIPLPAFFWAEAEPPKFDEVKLLVVDGLQRMTSMHEFAKNGFFLQGLESLTQFNYDPTKGQNTKYYFKDLPRPMQRRIEETPLTIFQIGYTPNKNVVRQIFKRLNTGGMPLSSQEIRHALYAGKATVLLMELAASAEFQKATTRSLAEARMQDQECILRFLAFRLQTVEKYHAANLDKFLCDALENLNDVPGQEAHRKALRENLRSDFLRVMVAARRIFGRNTFRKLRNEAGNGDRFALNKALFETWCVALSNCNDKQIETLVLRREALIRRLYQLQKGDWLPAALAKPAISFENAISTQTADTARVRLRFDAVRELVLSILAEGDPAC
jgi:hypothetical protein